MTEAIAHYDEALRLDPDDALTHRNRAIALAQESRLEEALDEDQAALRFDPDFEGARQALTLLKKGH
jgi:tetratricopeptide (TPR) repeat protein